MKKFLLLPAFCCYSVAFAQTKPVDCTAIKAENTALKEKLVAYEARLGIGVGGVVIEDGDPFVKVKFISCKASKTTRKAVLTYQLFNSGEPLTVEIHSPANQDNPSQVVDEQGQTYTSDSNNYPTVGKGLLSVVPSKVPFNGTLTFLDVPITTTRLNTVVLSFVKSPAVFTGKGYENYKTSIKNIPVTWVP
jgi:hypothetical protein